MNIKIKNINQSKLDLSNYGLKEIPEEVFELKNLKKLILRNNKIKNIPAEIEKLNRLETLDLSGNNISLFYAKICSLKNLKILNLNNNQLKNTPLQLTNLKKLRSIHLSNNRFRQIPSNIFSLHNLRELDISNNPIEIIDSRVENLKNLRKLWINNLKINNFPIESIGSLKSLNALYCYTKRNADDLDLDLDTYFKVLSMIKGNSIKKLNTLIANSKSNENKTLMRNKIREIKKIFITYAWSDEEFNTKIISFVDFLRKKGFDATLDRKKSQESVAINFNKMMIDGIANSDKVIVVLNKKYKERAEKFLGGVDTEFQIIFEDKKANPNKYIFVSFGDENIKDISPLAIGGTEILNLKKDQDDNNFNVLFSKIKEEQIINFSNIHDEEVEVSKVDIEPFKL
ncbi:leucine-rich repeat domain-containing protein [Chryseobacterium sp. KMC2]|uniref:leucine-rich repeat domain-containing protein n=1 Tax=Chryseobacterium sp. KMC2 TaxID=2800705 RepID=UPI0019233C2D|nr:leucine-rich repeat domain-containing protein [Chryseobacterium sp. KMC2]MBL3550569.1 leucine-rich repeat domain-containing protein [Chryseobacterium sp. KMC2]